MHCNSCSWIGPPLEQSVYPCLLCPGGTVVPTSLELLAEPRHGVVTDVRPAQLEMCKQAIKALNGNDTVVIEAGTGTGKSFAYLLPCIESYERVVICTAKKTLQEQLLNTDLPYLRNKLEALSWRAVTFEGLYGKNNYVCALQVATHNPTPVKSWQYFLEKSKTGYWGDIPQVFQNSSLAKITPNTDLSAHQCIGLKRCPYNKTCKYLSSRFADKTRQILVTNPWVLAAYNRYRSGVMDATVLVVDEAHQLERSVRHAYTTEIRVTAFNRLVSRYDRLTIEHPETCKSLAYRHEAPVLWNTLFEGEKIPGKSLFAFIEQLTTINNQLGNQCNADHATKIPELHLLTKNCDTLLTNLKSLVSNAQSNAWVSYLTKPPKTKYPSVTLVPLDVSSYIQQITAPYPTVIYTSATLDVPTFYQRVGIDPTMKGLEFHRYAAPFDYKNNALLYLNNDEQIDRLDLILELIEANRGNSFILFTANDDLYKAYTYLSRKTRLPLIQQGLLNSTPADALHSFKKTPNSVLLGVKSFWEGIDVPGNKLSQVIVYKLPFEHKEDPVMQARSAAIGANAFKKLQLPDMILDLRQGIGRLIRSKTDKGVISIIDPRLCTKSYGQFVLRNLNLPGIPITQDKDEALTRLRANAI